MQGIDIHEEKRPWGNFRTFTSNTESTVKLISVEPNQALSLQSHFKREEFWWVIAGTGTIEIDGVASTAKTGDEFMVPKESKHRITAGPDGIQILEIAFGTFDENDIVRYEDRYGRI